MSFQAHFQGLLFVFFFFFMLCEASTDRKKRDLEGYCNCQTHHAWLCGKVMRFEFVTDKLLLRARRLQPTKETLKKILQTE